MEDELKLEEQMLEDINNNCLEEQNTFNEDSVEELIDEEGSVENVSY